MPSARNMISGLVLAASAVMVPAVVMFPTAVAAQEASELLLDDVGAGWEIAGPDEATAQALTRRFVTTGAQLTLSVVPVDSEAKIRPLFQGLQRSMGDLTVVAEPRLPLASWLVPAGTEPGDRAVAVLVFASARGVFVAAFERSEVAFDPVDFLVGVAGAQIERAGGSPADSEGSEPLAVRTSDPSLERLLPDAVGSLAVFGTFDLGDDLPEGLTIGADIERYLDDGGTTSVRVWTSSDGSVVIAATLTRYPLELFAGATLDEVGSSATVQRVDLPGIGDIEDAVGFVGNGVRVGEVGVVLRRGSLVATVLGRSIGSAGPDEVAAQVVAVARALDGTLPPGPSSPYEFPGPRSKILGQVFSAVIVTTAASASVIVGRLRARRLRTRSRSSRSPRPRHAAAVPTASVIELDADAQALRRRARLVLGGQLVALNVSVGALAGDFGWPGAIVAVVSFLGGIGFTTWWNRREHAALGPVAPRIDRTLPRPGGAALVVASFAVLGFGAGFGVKGLRYLVTDPTLAQLKWADWFGMTPRAVGAFFFLGGLVLVVVGAALFRLARAANRMDSRRLLLADPRPPVLYLRSFEDDSVLLATIVSARRPLLELFSLRGADPFEESIAAELDTYGPVIAVGRPGRSLASLGAAREHLADATWREEVADRMTSARTVVVATGETDGLRWELERLVAAGHLDKTVFVFPPLPPDALARRWAFTSAALGTAGALVEELPVVVDDVHTVQVAGSGALRVTTAARRDEASYRTAVDRVMGAVPLTPADAVVPTPI